MEKVTIAISGLPGSGSTTIAKLLAKRLSLDYFSPGQLFKDIASGSYREKHYSDLFVRLCGENNLVIPEFSSDNDSEGALDLWQTEFGKSKGLHNVIDSLQRNLAEKGGIVIDGKLSLFILKNADVRIWLKSDFNERARRAAMRDSPGKKEIIEVIRKRQEAERLEWKKIYGIDYTEQEKLASIVLESSPAPDILVEKIISDINNRLLNR